MTQPKLRKITLTINDLLSLYVTGREHSTFICYMIRNKLRSEFSFNTAPGVDGQIQDSVKAFFAKYFFFSNSRSDNDCTIPLWFVNFVNFDFRDDGVAAVANAKNGKVLEFYNSETNTIRLRLIQHIAEFHPEAVLEIDLVEM